MVTISGVVENLVEDNPFIQEAMSRGIINYAALAQDIKSFVEKETRKPVKDSAIMMALRRLGEKMENKFTKKIKFDENADIFIKSDLFEITVVKSEKTFNLIKVIYELIDSNKDFLTITQGLTQVTIISNRRHKDEILEILKDEHILMKIENISSIGTTLPKNCPEEVGYFYTITRAFAWENIPIIEIVSTLIELNLIVKEVDIPRAFDVLKGIIKKNS